MPGPKDAPTLKVLRVTIAYPTSLPDGIAGPPMLTFDGYQPVPTRRRRRRPDEEPRQRCAPRSRDRCSGAAARHGVRSVQTGEWIYQKISPQPGDDAYLTWDAALRTDGRTVDLAGLDAPSSIRTRGRASRSCATSTSWRTT